MTARKSPSKPAVSPVSLEAYGRKLRGMMTKLERQLETARAQASRRGTRLLREASEYLGRVEERGERAWLQGRKEAARFLDRLEKMIEPPRGAARKKKSTARKGAARKKPR